MKKRIFSLLLAFGLALTLMPGRFCGGIRPHRRIPRDGLYVTIHVPLRSRRRASSLSMPGITAFSGGYFPVKGEYSTRHGQAYGLVDTSGNVVTQSWFLGGIPSYKVDNGIFKFWDGRGLHKGEPRSAPTV